MKRRRQRKVRAQGAVRVPVVAGIFYPGEKRPLADWVDQFLSGSARHSTSKRNPAVATASGGRTTSGGHKRPPPVVALVVPHGRYETCGEVAGSVYSQAQEFQVAVILAPQHALLGRKSLGLTARGVWGTPLGDMKVDEALEKELLKGVPDLEEDDETHAQEHAIEVQLPFLQRIKGVRRFVPIAFGEADLATVRRIGSEIAQVLSSVRQKVMLVVSTDFSRYEPEKKVQLQDASALESILKLDEAALLKGVEARSHSMCGAVPTAIGMVAAKRLGASTAELVRYQTSPPPTGEQDSVGGFAGLIMR